jgi:intracellular sulfur oxidation DsrE/DsrF family protein
MGFFKLPSRASRLILAVLLVSSGVAHGAQAPWGKAQLEDIEYAPQKVVYDVAVNNLKTFELVLDRVSYLNVVYGADPFGASIVVVLHGGEIPFFAIENFSKYEALMRRAQSLTLNGPIEFRMCRLAARGQGYEPKDIHGFVKMVPMADAEIVRLQREEGYAYMQ